MTQAQDKLTHIGEKLSKIPNFDTDIEGILDYMEILGEVDTNGVTPTISVSSHNGALRDDTLRESKKIMPQELLGCSQQKTVGNMIVLPNIMN